MQGCATGVNPGQQVPPVIQCHRLSQWYASGGKPLLPPFDRLYVCIASGEQRATQGCDPDGTEVTPVHERERPVEDYGPLLFLSNRVYSGMDKLRVILEFALKIAPLIPRIVKAFKRRDPNQQPREKGI